MTNWNAARKKERESRIVEAYLLQRRRDGTLEWSGLPSDLKRRDRPDFEVTLSDGELIGVEVTEAIEDETATTKNLDDELARHVLPVLRRHSPPCGLVDIVGGRRLPAEQKRLRADVADSLEREIKSSGGLASFLARLPDRCWRYVWPASDDRRSDSRSKNYTDFRFAVADDIDRWRIMAHGDVRGDVVPSRIESLVLERVRAKVASAAEYASPDRRLHLVIANPYGPHSPSEAVLAEVRTVAGAAPFGEIWLLNMDIDTLDVAFPEPFLVKLHGTC